MPPQGLLSFSHMGSKYTVGLYRDKGQENGNSYIIIGFILGICKDKGQENGSYYFGFRV